MYRVLVIECHYLVLIVIPEFFRLKTDLKQKETDLLSAKRELKELQNKFEQQQQMEADLSRKNSKTLSRISYSVF